MKISQIYLVFCLFGLTLMLSECKSKAESKQTENNKTFACKVVFNFGSYGSGIDSKKYDELTLILNEKKIRFTETVKGREGEKEICIPLTELKGKDKDDFIERLKKLEDKNTLVSLSIN